MLAIPFVQSGEIDFRIDDTGSVNTMESALFYPFNSSAEDAKPLDCHPGTDQPLHF